MEKNKAKEIIKEFITAINQRLNERVLTRSFQLLDEEQEKKIWSPSTLAVQKPTEQVLGNHLEWAHHIIILMFQPMAVPDIASGKASEANLDTKHLTRPDNDCVLESCFVRKPWNCRPGKDKLSSRLIGGDIKPTPIQYMELY